MKRTDAVAKRHTWPQPLYAQVSGHLLSRVKAGEWSPGETLPNEFALATEYNVSIGTIRRAIEGLERHGIMTRRQGRGTFIARDGRNPLEAKFTALRTFAAEPPGLSYEIEGIVTRRGDTAETEALQRTEPCDIIQIDQSVRLQGTLAGIESACVPADRFPRLDTQLTYGQHLYSVYSDYGVLVIRAEDIVTVGSATDEIARRLNIAPGDCILTVRRVAVTLEQLPIEYRVSHYLPATVAYACNIN